MAERIPQSFIDGLLARTDIIDIIDSYVPLRKAGKNHQARCPFHDEKTPSFSVSQEKQFYHCFGCGVSGSAITFLMEYHHMNFIEAIEDLASRAGLEVPRQHGAPVKEEGLSELYELMELVVQHYCKQLREHPDASRAVKYLKQRGISGKLAEEFEIGYAPAGWDNLIRQLGGSDSANRRLDKIGMTLKRQVSGYYDRFRDRIMFPIRDQRGRAIGFGGRGLGDETLKYLNSPETPIFHKGKELYGLYQVRRRFKTLDQLFVVEGYMDVLALAQFDIHNAVATLGTATTPDHLDRLFKNTSQVIICFDGDEAGKKATWRAMQTVLPQLKEGRQCFFMFMPDNTDPDDFVQQQGADAFQNKQNFTPLSDYLINTLKQGKDLSTREGRSRFIDEAIPFVSLLPQVALRQLILRDLADIARIPVSDLEPLISNQTKPSSRPRFLHRGSGQDRTAITSIIELILHKPSMAMLIDDPAELADFPVPGAPFLKQLVELVQTRPDITCAGIIENWRETPYAARLSEIASNSDEILSTLADPDKQLLDALDNLRRERDKQQRQKLTNINSMSDLTEKSRELLRKTGSERNKPPKK